MGLDPDTAKWLSDADGEALIFWAVLFFTSVAGIIELLPETHPLKTQNPVQGFQFIMITLLYAGLVAMLLFSIINCVRIYRSGRERLEEGTLGASYRDYVHAHPTHLDRLLLDKKGRVRRGRELSLYGLVIVFFTLFCTCPGFFSLDSLKRAMVRSLEA